MCGLAQRQQQAASLSKFIGSKIYTAGMATIISVSDDNI